MNYYFRAHKRTRSVVERGIGQWKRRFHVLHGEIRVSPAKTCKIIYACAILHNICKTRNIPLLVEDDVEDDAEVHLDVQENQALPAGQNVQPVRDYIANLHFK